MASKALAVRKRWPCQRRHLARRSRSEASSSTGGNEQRQGRAQAGQQHRVGHFHPSGNRRQQHPHKQQTQDQFERDRGGKIVPLAGRINDVGALIGVKTGRGRI